MKVLEKKMDLYKVSYIKELLERHGFHFSKSMGQNFLIDESVPRRIVQLSHVGREHGVLEIGPGIGALTVQLSALAGKVVSVELDKKLRPLLEETLSGLSNSTVVMGDILKTDIGALAEEHFKGLEPCVCANLPYNITTPVMTKLIDTGIFSFITVMIQREVARRICAVPGSGDYGAFTVYVNYHMEPQLLFDVPPGCFMPQPKVTSSVIKLVRRDKPPAEVQDKALFFRVVRASFAQRRKTLLNGLSAAFPVSKEELQRVIEDCGFDPRVRGETLSIGEFAMVANRLVGALK